MEFKKLTRKEIEEFSEEHFMEEEDIEKLHEFVRDFPLVKLDMEYNEKDKEGDQIGVLVIRIKEGT